MSHLLAPVCSITSTRRRRYLWAAWWTGAPAREPFRKPDASSGGARTREEALQEAERAAGRSLVLLDGEWARAWGRVLTGRPPWPRASTITDDAPRTSAAPAARARASAWAVLGVARGASLDEIKRAFRKRALATHPDHGGDPAQFREVRDAYDRAVTATKRKRAPSGKRSSRES